MSTKTNFKRIALVAVAALGMGVLSSVPSQAVIPATSISLTASATAGSVSTVTAATDSTTGATITLTFLAQVTNTDSVTLTVAPKSKPAAAAAYPTAVFTVTDTSTSTGAAPVFLEQSRAGVVGWGAAIGTTPVGIESGTAVLVAGTANRYTTLTAKVHLESNTSTRVAGAYVYTVIATPYDASNPHLSTGGVVANVKTVDVTINVAAAVETAAAAQSSACFTQGSSFAGVAGVGCVDSTVSVISTAGATTRAVVRVSLRTSTNVATANESVTVVSTLGNVGITANTPVGKNATFNYTAATGYLDILIFGDGTAGNGTITISTPSVKFAAKAINFYSTTVSKLTVINGAANLKVGSNTMTALGLGTVWVKAEDALGNNVVGSSTGGAVVWAYSATKTVVSDSATACTYSSDTTYHHCSLTGVAAGTSVITVANSSTNESTATVKGDKAVTVTVNANIPATLALAFDKATYAPGERGFIFISAKDSAGATVPGQVLNNLISSSGISVTKGSITGSAGASLTLTGADNTSPTTAVRVAAVDTCDTLASGLAVRCITFIAPVGGGDIEITATGGSGLPAAGQVAVKASAKVTDNAAAALAAVTALATTVASLRTLITTLTNLVLKIQKKVKA
jgi:hypothetical protein